MDRDDRKELHRLIENVSDWIALARSVRQERQLVRDVAELAAGEILQRRVDVAQGHEILWRVLPLVGGDQVRLGALVRATTLPPLPSGEDRVIDQLLGETVEAVAAVRTVIGATRFFRGTAAKGKAAGAADYLRALHAWSTQVDLPRGLSGRIEEARRVRDVDLRAALHPSTGLRAHLSQWDGEVGVVDAAPATALARAMPHLEAAVRNEAALIDKVRGAAAALRQAETRTLLLEMPVARLKDATGDRLRLGSLTDAGIVTVQQVLDNSHVLRTLPGVGDVTATRMAGAARALWQSAYDDMPVRLDIRTRTPQATALLRELIAWDSGREVGRSPSDLQLIASLSPALKRLEGASQLVVVGQKVPVGDFQQAVEGLLRRARALATPTSTGTLDPWDEFLSRPADFYAMLSELGFLTEDEEKSHGDLPDDIVEAIRQTELDVTHLKGSLRGYQSFGARFALCQRKVIVGDEMGLGKTFEALAVLGHLRAKGGHHFLVVCPAAVVTNWVREITAKSTLAAHRIHGPGRDAAAVNWIRRGGVAVTTFETLAWFESRITQVEDLGCVVVDEAHYIKNPGAKRSLRTSALIDATPRAILLTGTPLENRLTEFKSLVGYVRPDLVVDESGLSARRFRQQVAPAYLRRNQEDVLTELPELVEVDEWLPMSLEDEDAYRDAVASGNFAAMRQAAMTSGDSSEKLQRLIELVEEAEENGRRVIVFSHFLGVLQEAAAALPGRVFGPLTGSVPAAARQRMVDEFSTSRGGSVLVAQIIAGGVGLNIQAASIVVICEPQLKPTTEWQAIARAHRMGQLDTVQVHRLLSDEGVDVRVTEILARKKELFAEFARVSDTAESAPEALDISEAELSREVIAAERERLFSEGVSHQSSG